VEHSVKIHSDNSLPNRQLRNRDRDRNGNRKSGEPNRFIVSLSSLFILGAVIAAAIKIVPMPLGKPSAAYLTQGTVNAHPGKGPVFILDDQLFPHQCGKARLSHLGELALFAYHDEECQTGVMNLRPYLLAVDPRVPWALVPQNEREDLRKLAMRVAERLETVGVQLLYSAFFEQEYAPLLQDIAKNAFHTALLSPAADQVLSRAMDTFDRRQVERILEGLLPIFLEKAKKNLWQTLRGYTESVINGEEKGNQEAMTKLGEEVFADPRVKAHLAETLPPLLTSREISMVGMVLIRETGRAIWDDPRTMQLANRLMADQRLASLQPFSSEAEYLIQVLPLRLLRMRHRLDHNPLATYVLRTLVRGRKGFLVLLLSPEQEKTLTNSQLPAGPALRRMEP